MRPEGIDLGAGNPGDNRLTGTVEDINFLGSVVRIRLALGDAVNGTAATAMTLDTFNEPHLSLPPWGAR